MGVMLVGKMTVGFVLFMEMLPESDQVKAGVLVMSGFPIAQILSSIILTTFTKNVNVLLQMGFFLNLVSFSLGLLMPESP